MPSSTSSNPLPQMSPYLLLLLLLLLPISSLADFTPNTSHWLACGAATAVSDAASRSFVPDNGFLSSSKSAFRIPNPNSHPPSPLYGAARAATDEFSYRLPVKPSSNSSSLVLRLHFFPFPSSSHNLSSALFDVSALDHFLLLSDFSPQPAAPTIKEFFVPVDASVDNFVIRFKPKNNSLVFVNAIELFTAPPELLSDPTPKSLPPAPHIGALAEQALETVYRVNVGGKLVTPNNDTLWRTWQPDDPFLYSDAVSVPNSTTSLNNDAYDPAAGRTAEVAPLSVYDTARTMNVTSLEEKSNPGLNFNVTWNFFVEGGYNYLVRLHFCDFMSAYSSVVGEGLSFNVYIVDDWAFQDLTPQDETSLSNPGGPFYKDVIYDMQRSGNLSISIGPSLDKKPENAILNGLEIMKMNNSVASLSGAHNPYDSGHSGKSKRRRLVVIVLSCVLGAAVLACVALGVFAMWCRRRRRQRPASEAKESTPVSSWSPYARTPEAVGSVDMSSKSGGTNGSTPHKMNLGLLVSFAEIKAATDNFNERNLIGNGGFGKVYKGVLSDGRPVAVKRAARGSKQGFPEFQTEIVVLSRIRHRHLVSLIGYCDEQSEMILVYEYMEKGPLRSYLYGSDKPPLSWKQRLEICIGAARGLHYLHTGYSDNIIHRDVKSTNILLGEGFVPKVADFGLSRVGPSYGQTHVSTAVKGSFGYLDPEYFKTQQLTDRSDVYSFGVVLFEVLCARPVIDPGLARDQINLAEWALSWQNCGQLEKIVDPKLAGNVNENSLRKFGETAAKCLADFGVDRPTMGDVLWNLEYCLQLQETELRREPHEDSGNVDSQIHVQVVRRMPSASSVAAGDHTSVIETDMTMSKVFSQLMTGDGR